MAESWLIPHKPHLFPLLKKKIHICVDVLCTTVQFAIQIQWFVQIFFSTFANTSDDW